MSFQLKKCLYFILFILIILSGIIQAQEKTQEAKGFTLTIDNIMKGPELVGTAPSGIMWSVDGKKLYFRWQKPGEEKADFYAVTKSNLTPQKITVDEILENPPFPAPYSTISRLRRRGPQMDIKYDKAREKALFIQSGDIRLIDLRKGKIIPVTLTEVEESNADFTFDQKKIYFTCQENLFLLTLGDFSLRQMTSFTRKPPTRKEPDEIEKWYQEQQKELFQQFKKEQERMDQGEIFPSVKEKRKPFILKKGQRLVSLDLSPDEKYVVFILSEDLPESEGTIVPNYVTRTGYTEDIESRTKAAQSASENKAGIMDVSTGEVKWVDYGQGERKIFPLRIFWSPDGNKCALTGRSDDREDEWLFLVDIESGKTSIIEHVHDDAWVERLGLMNIVWWPDGQHISYISEKDGFAHLYKASLDAKDIKQLTNGRFEVQEALFSNDKKKWYLTTSEEHPGEFHFYSMPAEGGKRTKITSMIGRSQTALSPDESSLAILYSLSTRPPEVYLQPNKPGAKAQQVTLSPTEAFLSYPWHEPEIVTFKARDGVDVYARLYRPEKWHPQRPAVIFIHGAGYMQNVHKGWSSYYREYMFQNFLMKNGYLVFDIDYRGSAGYGRDCRTAIYRHMGGKDLDDIVDGARYLVKEHNAHPERIGVYGGSYGGFLTLMAVFTAPDDIKAGASLRPVTDWAHYNNTYSGNILNLPQEDSESYQKSSPINFAEGLKGALLICHGMMDTNVHFQDTVRLAQRLIELGKENWEVAIYPVEGHGFQNATSWADEYKRIFKLFEQNLK